MVLLIRCIGTLMFDNQWRNSVIFARFFQLMRLRTIDITEKFLFFHPFLRTQEFGSKGSLNLLKPGVCPIANQQRFLTGSHDLSPQ